MDQASSNRVIETPRHRRIQVAGEDGWFPVGQIYCIGRNYSAHAREMGHDPDREPPFFFLKAAGALGTGGELPYPSMTRELHHEVELVVGLSSGGRELSPDEAGRAVFGAGVGIDFTRRDLQAEAKRLQRPWDTAKSFTGAAQCSPIRRLSLAEIEAMGERRLELSVDGELRQSGTLSQMIWSVRDQIVLLSRYFELAPGDLIFTGTPAGVGPCSPGERILARIEGVAELQVTIRSGG